MATTESAASAPDAAQAWAAYESRPGEPWDRRRAGHLLRRAGFGGTWDQLHQAVTDGPQTAVGKLLRPTADVAAFNRAQDGLEAGAANSDSSDGLRAWWLRRMILTPHPLLEKLTLFWHNYFAIHGLRAGRPLLMAQHLHQLRHHALGRFDALLEAMLQDPAVWLGLDAGANRKAALNEHAARVWLECYTVGPDQHSPQDVRELARALTGHFVLRNELRFIEREYDDGEKQILSRRGRFNAQQAVRVLLEHPATPRRVVRQLYRWLVAEDVEPSEALVAPLAAAFAKDWNIATLIETILRSGHFASAAAYRHRVKSPVEFAVGLVRSCEGLVDTVRLGQDLASLGQNLYHPPTVRGWQGGTAWINPATVLARQNLALGLLGEAGPYAGKLDLAAVVTKHSQPTPDAQARFLIDLFLQGDLPGDVRDDLLRDLPTAPSTTAGEPARWLRHVAHRLVALPEYELA